MDEEDDNIDPVEDDLPSAAEETIRNVVQSELDTYDATVQGDIGESSMDAPDFEEYNIPGDEPDETYESSPFPDADLPAQKHSKSIMFSPSADHAYELYYFSTAVISDDPIVESGTGQEAFLIRAWDEGIPTLVYRSVKAVVDTIMASTALTTYLEGWLNDNLPGFLKSQWDSNLSNQGPVYILQHNPPNDPNGESVEIGPFWIRHGLWFDTPS